MTDEKELWRHNFKQVIFFVEVAQENLQVAPSSNGVAERSIKDGLREGVFHHLLEEKKRKAIYNAELRKIVDPVLEAAVTLLDDPIATPQEFVEGLEKIATLCREATETIDWMEDEEEVEQVIDEFETRYLATLATTLSSHFTIATKLAKHKPVDGEYFDVGTYIFSKDPGPGRVHVADLHKAMDSGVSTTSFKRGFVSYERFPPIQLMTYGQWFAYIHAVWDEWYRPRLAAAYSRQLGEKFVKDDIKSAFMGELNKIRNDVIHNQARVNKSEKNKILAWATADGMVGMTTERMLGLREMFPRDELLTPPNKGEAPKTKLLPWTATVELIEEVTRLAADLGLSRREKNEIGNEMLRLWLSNHSGE